MLWDNDILLGTDVANCEYDYEAQGEVILKKMDNAVYDVDECTRIRRLCVGRGLMRTGRDPTVQTKDGKGWGQDDKEKAGQARQTFREWGYVLLPHETRRNHPAPPPPKTTGLHGKNR
ncbi:hypothetical protein JB92DRAFT_2832103 [Gautieria morchelliformis]|nr:hypothetical protein JB92DRAFT_2832103 [Gautieria morchelliformis]